MTYARSRSRVGAKPRITRYARNNPDQYRVLNPLTQLPVYAGVWMDDPAWVNGGVGTAPASLLLGGSLYASGAHLDPTNGLVLPSNATVNGASVPSAAALQLTGDFDVCGWVVASDYTATGLTQTITADYDFGANKRSWSLAITDAGNVQGAISTDGITATAVTRTPASPFVDGQLYGFRMTRRASDGRVQLFQTSDGPDTVSPSWTQIGTDATGPTGALYTSDALKTFGCRPSAGALTNALVGNVRRVIWKDSIGGTTVLDVDFRRARTNQFTASTGQTVTVSSSFDPTQGTPAARGTLTTSALLGGRRVLDLDGTDDCYPLTTGVSLAQPFEVWAIAVTDSTTGNRHILGANSASSVNRVGIASAQWAARFGAAGSAILGGTPAIATAYAARFVANGASSAIYANGVSQATGGFATDAMDQFIVGAGRTAPSTYASFYDGPIACLLTLPAASITQAHRTAAGQWAARFYGVAGFAGAFG